MIKKPDKQPNNKNLNMGRWKKGESGNPNGRPRKDICITSRQKEMLSEICPFDNQGKTWRDALAEAGMRLALIKPEAMRDFMDRHWGKVTQPIGGEGGQPIKTEIIVSGDTAKKLLTEIIKGVPPHAVHHD